MIKREDLKVWRLPNLKNKAETLYEIIGKDECGAYDALLFDWICGELNDRGYNVTPKLKIEKR